MAKPHERWENPSASADVGPEVIQRMSARTKIVLA